MLLGGLISTDSSHGYSGVPILSDIPLVGRIFRVEKENDKRTELVMLIIPYIIDDDQDAVANHQQPEISVDGSGGRLA